MHPVERKFQKVMSQVMPSETRVLVAVSGGPDSVVLLHLLNKYKIIHLTVLLPLPTLITCLEGLTQIKIRILLLDWVRL